MCSKNCCESFEDVLTPYSSTNAFVRDTLLVAAASQSPQSEQLLDDFFEVSQTPNPAEVAFLSDVTGFDQDQIQEYCKTLIHIKQTWVY